MFSCQQENHNKLYLRNLQHSTWGNKINLRLPRARFYLTMTFENKLVLMHCLAEQPFPAEFQSQHNAAILIR